jgi:hypothetical protein
MFASLFPDPIKFLPIQKGRRKGWRLVGTAKLRGFTLRGDQSPPGKPATGLASTENLYPLTLDCDPDGI